MSPRRALARRWRRWRRPTLGRLCAASVALHLAAFLGLAWLSEPVRIAPRRPSDSLVVELPPAEPGTPLVRPEQPARSHGTPARATARAAPTPPPAPRPPSRAEAATPSSPPPRPAESSTSPPAPPANPVESSTPSPPPARPAPPSLPAVAVPAPAPVPVPPTPSVATGLPAPPVPESPAPPALAAVTPPPGPARGLAPAAALAAPPGDPAPPPPSEPVPGPQGPVVAAKPPEPEPPAPSGVPREAIRGSGEPVLSGRGFSLLAPRLDVPAAGGPARSGSGGARPKGSGQGEAGTEREGQPAIPLNTPDPRYADYFLEIKRRIEAQLVYPQEAARQHQSGQLVLEFVVKKDGTVSLVELTRSSGVGLLDRYSLNTVRLAAPFPPIPDRMGLERIQISANFTYILERGFRLGGLR